MMTANRTPILRAAVPADITDPAVVDGRIVAIGGYADHAAVWIGEWEN